MDDPAPDPELAPALDPEVKSLAESTTALALADMLVVAYRQLGQCQAELEDAVAERNLLRAYVQGIGGVAHPEGEVWPVPPSGGGTGPLGAP